MRRILFVTVPERGHYHPLIGPAQHLARAGHSLAFWAACDIGDALHAARLREVLVLHSEAKVDVPTHGAALARIFDSPLALRAWVRSLLLDGVDRQVAELSTAIAQFRPDVIACDPMVYAAVLAANRAQLPWLALSSSLNPVLPPEMDSELLATVRNISSERQGLFDRWNCAAAFRGCDCLSPYATLAFCTEALVGPAPAGVELVGPSRPIGIPEACFAAPNASLDPFVYASLGSQNWHQPAFAKNLIEAVRDRPVRLLLSAGGLAASCSEVPPNVRVVEYADQRAALNEAHLFITHGGANSVIEGLDAGVPLLVSAFVNDQPHNAWFVERAQAGQSCRLDEKSPKEIWTQMEMLLGDCIERKNAERIRRSFRATDGARVAASRILALCS